MAKLHDLAPHTAKRMQAVAQFKLRHGWGSRRIADELAKHEELHNPATGKPYDSSTVRLDLQTLERGWLREAARDMATMKAQHLESIREARSAAWQKQDIPMVLRALGQEADLLGLNAPTKVAPTTPDGKESAAFPLLQIISTQVEP